MKLLVDLLPCQTNNRLRGIGRFSLSLVKEMVRIRGPNEFYPLADIQLSESYEDLRKEFSRILPASSFLPYHNGITRSHPFDWKVEKQIASTFTRQAYQVVSPDVVLIPSPFEMDLRSIVPGSSQIDLNFSYVGILHDLIPYIFHEQYLDGNSEYKNEYLKVINALSNYDLLLTNSERTRQDAINLIHLSPDKVVNIYGAVSPFFKKLDISEKEKSGFFQRYGISRPFVLYIGGNDYRKNMEGALYAYAQLPTEVIASHQLVMNDVGDETIFRRKASSFGLKDQDVAVTGFVSDEDLLLLYNLCKVFIFPSLYEGFGFPILEAMACGAPVIAANNSSIPEVVGRTDVLFNAADKDEITSVLHKVLVDENFRKELAAYGPKQARQFNWEKSAQRAWVAIEEMHKKGIAVKCPSHQVNDRPRIAFVSPLPPQKSGISYYSQGLLPFLSTYFDIDLFIDPDVQVSNDFLIQNFSIFPWTKLLDLKDQYKTVVYQHGNSSFHAHMIDLEQQFPGVVVLHDFYLGDLVNWVCQQNELFVKEVDYNHGFKGLVDYQKKNTWIIEDLPFNWKVLRCAREIIVHSNYCNEVLEQIFGRGWRPNLRIIPLFRLPVSEITDEQRLQARKDLGINIDSFLFCSFGMLTPVKMIEPIIQAFAAVKQKLSRNAKLIFVGEYISEDYAQQIANLLEKEGLTKQVIVTGYVDDNTYNKYLISANVAIQLRKRSRGETSAATLDCMNHGIPTIVSKHGTFNELDDQAVFKISDPVQLEELSSSMLRLFTDEMLRIRMGHYAHQVILDRHNPEKIASAYAEVIYRAIRSDDRELFTPLITALGDPNNSDETILSVAEAAARNFSLRNQPRLFIDVTQTVLFDVRSGIQRVVKNIIRELLKLDLPGLQLEPIWYCEGQFLRAHRFTEKILDLPKDSLGPEITIQIRPGDNLCMLDSSWQFYEQFTRLFEEIRQAGGKISTVVYDLIAIRYPTVTDEPMSCLLKKWLKLAIQSSDILACISASTAKDVEVYAEECEFQRSVWPEISYFHLGSDITIIEAETNIRSEVALLSKKDSAPTFVMVGTLEPRKGHNFVLDAFELLWQKGYPYRLCFAGKFGWNIEKLEQRIHDHPELGKRFIFIENPTDAEINHCYQNSTALIMASLAEGFGLPIIEAAQYELPVIASDIPVFHEVGGEGVLYFSLESSSHLVQAIIDMLNLSPSERSSLVKKVKHLTWKQSAVALLNVLDNQRKVII